ncbi:MAG: GNAT family N-acetyltransferase [Fimbriimonadaceae bacterium]|jgi:GNAT superfamily N-acetyltransferase|nr:GNAT family N-acetyltransferase [Fimbriimonadaceae bacterium]
MKTLPIVRPYHHQKDQESVVEAVKAVYFEYGFTWDPEDYHSDLFNIPGEYLDTGGDFWVAEIAGEVVGCVGLVPHAEIPGAPGTTTLHEGKIRVSATQGELVRLYVHPNGRGHGLGIALTQTVMTRAKERGLKSLELWSDKHFTHAHAVYRQLGAVIVGERICDDPDEAPEWGMKLDLL